MYDLYYFHDPMCSWCYAFKKTLESLEQKLPERVGLTKIVAGLAADSSEPMSAEMKLAIKSNWQRIENTVAGVEFNYQFWEKNQPFRSTYASCRAVLAAKKQLPAFENKMIQQIQLAYYKNAENPSLDKTLINCAELIGLNVEVFKKDFNSQSIEDLLQTQIAFTKNIGVSSYPSLRLVINKQVLSIDIDYNDANVILEQIMKFKGDRWD